MGALLATLATAKAIVNFTPDSGAVRQVATAGSVLNWPYAPGSGRATVTRHLLTANASALTLSWTPRQPPLGTQANSDTTIRCAIRLVGSTTWRPLTFAGSQSAVLSVSSPATVTADAITGEWREGSQLEILVWAASGGIGLSSSYWDADGTVALVGTWEQATAANPAFTTGDGQGFRPTAVTAASGTPAWLVVGDSILARYGHGYAARAMVLRSRASILSAEGGEAYANFPLLYSTKVTPHIGKTTSVLCQYGINDSPDSGTFNRAAALAFWNQLVGSGIGRIVVCTLTPSSNSTDNWTTLANQTPNRTTRVQYNTWVRDGAPLVGGAPAAAGTTDPAAVRARVIRADGTIIAGTGTHPLGNGWVSDIAAVVESSQDSGKWRVDLGSIGGDGLHMTRTGHLLAADRLARDMALMNF